MNRKCIPCLLMAGLISACSSSSSDNATGEVPLSDDVQTQPVSEVEPGIDALDPAPEVDPVLEVDPVPKQTPADEVNPTAELGPAPERDLASDFPDEIPGELEAATLLNYITGEAENALITINQNVSQGSITEADLDCIVDPTMSTVVTSIICDPARPVGAGQLDFASVESPKMPV